MKRLLEIGMISLSMSISYLLARLVTLSFGFVLISFVASTKHYEVGSVYKYDYVLAMELSEPKSDKTPDSESMSSTVGYKILTQVLVKSIWHSEQVGSLLEIQLVKPQLQIKSRKAPQPEGFREHSSNLDSASLEPLFVHWKNGQVESTFSTKTDDASLVNIKKGIANILQVQTSEGEVLENTPAGQCKVIYKAIDSFHLSKRISGQCDSSKREYFYKTHKNDILGSQVISDVNVTLSMSRDTGVVGEVEVSENHVVGVNVKNEVGASIKASQSLKLADISGSSKDTVTAADLENVLKEVERKQGIKLKSDNLMPEFKMTAPCEFSSCKSIQDMGTSLSPENIASSKMAAAFLQLVTKFRDSPPEEIRKLLLRKSEIMPQILDACAASGRPELHRIVMKAIDFHQEDNIELPERYLLGLSLSSNPAPEVLMELFKLLKRQNIPSAKLQESLLLTISAIANTISEQSVRASRPQSHLHQEIQEYLINALSSCEGENAGPCKELYLRALKNFKSKATVPFLFDVLQNSELNTPVVAIKALHAMPDSNIDNQYRPFLVKAILQLGKKYDSSVRTMALDMILRNNPSKDELRQIVKFLLAKVSDKQHAEVSTFMWNRLFEFAESNPKLEVYMYEIIAEEKFNTYHHLAPRGLSTAFTRFFSKSSCANSSFSNSIEMNGKILKRSLFDVFLQKNNQAFQLLSLGIFADGLSSFASSDGESEQEENEVEATAGMELSLMEVQIRPLVFFVGKGDLMGLVWSGAGSERTSAIMGNVLLQDDRKIVPMYNGLVADISIQGGLSFDLAGQIQISLWHRTANSLVENKAGLVLQSVVRADTSFVRSRVDYTVASEAALHFTSDINFYQGVIMCLKLTQPEFKIRENIHKTERIPGSKHKLRKAKYKTYKIPGITYALNKKNSELCGVMYKDEL